MSQCKRNGTWTALAEQKYPGTLWGTAESRNDAKGNSDSSFPCPSASSAHVFRNKDSCHIKATQQHCSVLTTEQQTAGENNCVRCSNCTLEQVKSCNISTFLYNREKWKKKHKSSQEAREKYYSGSPHTHIHIAANTPCPPRHKGLVCGVRQLLCSHPLIDELSPFFWSLPHDQETGFVLI